MWTAIGLAFSAIVNELLSLWFTTATKPTIASDAVHHPDGLYGRFRDLVQRIEGRTRPPS